MSNDISIHVTIGGRKYPLTVAAKDEDMVKSVAADLDKTVTALKQNYAVQDRQDLMAMAALQVAVKQTSKVPKPNSDADDSDVSVELKLLFDKSQSLL